MRSFVPDQNIVLTVALAGLDGSPVTISAGNWRLTDEAGNELLPAADLGLTDPVTAVSVTVPAAQNSIAADVPYAVRIVEITGTIPEGTHRQAYGYMLLSSEPLKIGVNSFQSLIAADALAVMLPTAAAYRTASVTDKVAAMSFAREQMCLLEYRLINEGQNYLVSDHPVVSDGYRDLSSLTSLEIGLMNAGFRKALCRAQILQANYLLGGDAAEQQREAGVLSVTVGESSQMFRAGMRPLDMPLCRAAVAALHGYLKNPFACKIARS